MQKLTYWRHITRRNQRLMIFRCSRVMWVQRSDILALFLGTAQLLGNFKLLGLGLMTLSETTIYSAWAFDKTLSFWPDPNDLDPLENAHDDFAQLLDRVIGNEYNIDTGDQVWEIRGGLIPSGLSRELEELFKRGYA